MRWVQMERWNHMTITSIYHPCNVKNLLLYGRVWWYLLLNLKSHVDLVLLPPFLLSRRWNNFNPPSRSYRQWDATALHWTCCVKRPHWYSVVLHQRCSAALFTRCRPFLSWLVHKPCHFVMLPVRMLSIVPLSETKRRWQGRNIF